MPSQFDVIIVVAAAAAALILAPSAAMAYEAPGFNFTVSDSTPTVGAPFTATISGADANTVVTLTITCQNAGVRTLTETASASGVASFSVTLAAVGTCTLTATNVTGAVVATQTVLGVSADAAGTSNWPLTNACGDKSPSAEPGAVYCTGRMRLG